MKRRLLTIVAALALAAFGTGAVLAYVSRADARALAGMKAVTVLVAQRQIPSGTPAALALRDGSLRRERLPAAAVPANAVRSLSPELGSLVASAVLQPGQVLLRPSLVPPAEASDGLAIPPGLVAVTIPLCLPQAVAGYVRAGSQVALFDTYASKGSAGQQSCTQAGSSQQLQAAGPVYTRVVLPRVQVLSVAAAPSRAVGQAGSTASQAGSPVLVTLAVSQADAERVIQVAEVGLPYLALLTPLSRTGPDSGTQLFQP
jgi:pilus assembly protein CpaB